MKRRPFPVLLTFDLDAESGALARDPENATRPVTLSVGQYGPTVGLPRILSVLRELMVPATFFVPGWVAEQYPAAIASILEGGHELAHHGWDHTPPARLSPEEEEGGLLRGIDMLRRMSGVAPQGYRAPSWEFSSLTLPLLTKHGFLYSSNFMNDDAPYLHRLQGRTLVELPVQWMLDDFPFFGVAPVRGLFGISPIKAAYDVWTQELDSLHAEGEGKCFVLTMHPQCMGRPSRVQLLRRFIDHAMKLPDVELLRCRELAGRVYAAR
jgi:peptidoglycan/xylan/chitin deacetylase (PgdA/CDA1 family)